MRAFRWQQARILGFISLAATLAAASVSGVWETKDYKDWTAQDAQSVLSNSPWAKQRAMPAGGRQSVTVYQPGDNGAPAPSAALGNPANSTSGSPISRGANPGNTADASGTREATTAQSPSGMNASAGAPEPNAKLTVVWASATPVRLAVLKIRAENNTPSESEIEHASKVDRHYVIAVVGLPPPDSDTDPKSLAKNAFLSAKNKQATAAVDSDYRKIGNSDVYFFRFDKASLPLSATDGHVDFKMRMGRTEIKSKFDLNQMEFQHALSL